MLNKKWIRHSSPEEVATPQGNLESSSQEDLFAQSQAILETVLDSANDAAFVISAPQLSILDANQAATRFLGYTRSKLLRLKLSDLLPTLFPTSDMSQEAVIDSLLSDIDSQSSLRAVQRRKDGTEFPVEVTITRLAPVDRDLLIVWCRDISDRQRLERLASSDAHHDPLTGLPNRILVESRIQKSIERAQQEDYLFGVLFIDVDQLKQINDTQGHRAGDQVLRVVAQRLAGCIRGCDLVARFGGDEFVMLLEDVRGTEQVEQICTRIRRTLASPLEVGGKRKIVQASIGGVLGDGEFGGDDLLEQADREMYQMKSKHRHAQITRPATRNNSAEAS